MTDRVQHLAGVVDSREVEELDLARFRIDGDLGDLDGEAGHFGSALLVGVARTRHRLPGLR